MLDGLELPFRSAGHGTVRLSRPCLERATDLAVGGGAVFVAVHLIFAAGVYLAGANYAKILLRWFASRFLRIHLSHSKRQ